MSGSIVKTATSLLVSMSSRQRPWQMALAMALGMLCGLVPKVTVLFAGLMVLCYLLPIHLPLALVTTLFVSVAGHLLHPMTGRLGLWALTHPHASEFWRKWHEVPLLPWLGLYDTVIHGSLALGLAMALPVFLVAWTVFSRLLTRRIPRVRPGAKLDPDRRPEIRPHVSAIQLPADTSSTLVDTGPRVADSPPPIAVTADLADETSDASQWDPMRRLESLLARTRDQATSADVNDIVQRSSQMTELVDEMIAGLEETQSLGNPAEGEHEDSAEFAESSRLGSQGLGDTSVDIAVGDPIREEDAEPVSGRPQSEVMGLTSAASDSAMTPSRTRSDGAQSLDETQIGPAQVASTPLQERDRFADQVSADQASDATRVLWSGHMAEKDPTLQRIENSPQAGHDITEDGSTPKARDSNVLGSHNSPYDDTQYEDPHSAVDEDGETVQNDSYHHALDSQHDEALRYLLLHLKQIRDRV